MKRMSRCGAVRAEVLCKPHAFDSAHRQETRAQRRSARAKIAWNTARRCDRIEEREEFVSDAHFLTKPGSTNFLFSKFKITCF